jgi:hypothetical protein
MFLAGIPSSPNPLVGVREGKTLQFGAALRPCDFAAFWRLSL